MFLFLLLLLLQRKQRPNGSFDQCQLRLQQDGWLVVVVVFYVVCVMLLFLLFSLIVISIVVLKATQISMLVQITTRWWVSQCCILSMLYIDFVMLLFLLSYQINVGSNYNELVVESLLLFLTLFMLFYCFCYFVELLLPLLWWKPRQYPCWLRLQQYGG